MAESLRRTGGRWAFRLALALVLVIATTFVVRSAMSPAATAAVFVSYADGSDWAPAPESALFETGVIEFAGFEPVQLGGNDLGTWDEVVLVSFDEIAAFDAFAADLAAAEAVERYHLLALEPQARELLWFTNWRLRSFRDDAPIAPGNRVPLPRAVPATPYPDRRRGLCHCG